MVVRFFSRYKIAYFLDDIKYEHWKKSKSANKGVDRFWGEVVEGVMIIQDEFIYLDVVKPTPKMKEFKELVDMINRMK
jgi:hypothetical protein